MSEYDGSARAMLDIIVRGVPGSDNVPAVNLETAKKGITAPWVDLNKVDWSLPPGHPKGPGPGASDILGGGGSDPFNKYSENNDTRSNNEEESGVEPVALAAGASFDPSGWQLTPAPYVPYTPPAAQDWSVWMFGSPFGGEGGLAYQPGSREYLTRFIPENVWGSRSGLSQGVLAELAPSTGGLLSEALPRYESRGARGSLSNATSSATSSASPGLLSAFDKPYDDTSDGSLGVTEAAYGDYMRRHPDLMDDYNENWKKKGVTPEEYGAMHYWEYGKKEGRV